MHLKHRNRVKILSFRDQKLVQLDTAVLMILSCTYDTKLINTDHCTDTVSTVFFWSNSEFGIVHASSQSY